MRNKLRWWVSNMKISYKRSETNITIPRPFQLRKLTTIKMRCFKSWWIRSNLTRPSTNWATQSKKRTSSNPNCRELGRKFKMPNKLRKIMNLRKVLSLFRNTADTKAPSSQKCHSWTTSSIHSHMIDMKNNRISRLWIRQLRLCRVSRKSPTMTSRLMAPKQSSKKNRRF